MPERTMKAKIALQRVNTLAICTEIVKLRMATEGKTVDKKKAMAEAKQTIQNCTGPALQTLKQ
jgi:hypothetical protein